MSMTSSIKGVRDLDGKFADMIAVKYACEKAQVPYPKEVKDYFRFPIETEDYLRKEMEEIDIDGAVEREDSVYADVWRVDLSKLPKECKAIRFTNSY